MELVEPTNYSVHLLASPQSKPTPAAITATAQNERQSRSGPPEIPAAGLARSFEFYLGWWNNQPFFLSLWGGFGTWSILDDQIKLIYSVCALDWPQVKSSMRITTVISVFILATVYHAASGVPQTRWGGGGGGGGGCSKWPCTGGYGGNGS